MSGLEKPTQSKGSRNTMGVRCDDCGAKMTPGWRGGCAYCDSKRLRAWLLFIEGGAGLTSDAQREAARAALDGKPAPKAQR